MPPVSPLTRFRQIVRRLPRRLLNPALRGGAWIAAECGEGEVERVTPDPQPIVVSSTRKLRIALEVERLGLGGAEQVVLWLARGLEAEGLEAVVVCSRSRGERETEPGTSVVANDGHGMEAVYRELAPDIVIGHGSSDGFPAAHALGIPTVFVFHNMPIWLSRRDATVLAERIARGSCVAVSSRAREYAIRRFGVRGDQIRVIPIGLPESRMPERRTAPKVSRAPVILSVGSIEGGKGQLHLLGAAELVAAQYPDLTLVLAGYERDSSYADRLRRLAAKGPLANRVRMLGHVTDVASLYDAADVFALLSTHEGFGMASLEAAMAGLPLVITRTGAAEALVEEAGIVVPTAYGRPPWQTNRWELSFLEDVRRPAHVGATARALLDVLGAGPAFRARAEARRPILRAQYALARMCRSYADLARATVEGHGDRR